MADRYLWANNAIASLGADIASGATSITVATGEGSEFPSPSVGERFAVTIEDVGAAKLEICYCTARSGDTLTVVRGQEGTIAQAFTAATTTVSNRVTAAGLNGILAAFSDADHGVRGGGTLHAEATTGVAGFLSATDKVKLDSVESGATADLTGSEILALLLPVDGNTSGLDADLLDGNHASAFGLLSGGNSWAGTNTFTGVAEFANNANFENATFGGAAGRSLVDAAGNWIFQPTTAVDTFATTKEFYWNQASQRWEFDETPYVGANTIWHAGNLSDPAKLSSTQTFDGLNTFQTAAYTIFSPSSTAQTDQRTIRFASTVTDFLMQQWDAAGGVYRNRISMSGASAAANALSLGTTVLAWGGNTVWHAGNDGSGSTLDADLLDAQEGSYYRNATNINAGTLADARLSTNVGLLNTAQTHTGDKTFSGIVSITDNGSGLLQFTNATYGGRLGRVFGLSVGDWVFRPSSSAGVDDSARDFFFNKASSRWQFDGAAAPYVDTNAIWHGGNLVGPVTQSGTHTITGLLTMASGALQLGPNSDLSSDTGSIADDGFVDVTPSNINPNASGLMIITNPNGGCAIVYIDIFNNSNVGILAQVGTTYAATALTGAPTGTTGVDTKVTVFVDSVNNKIYVENRSGSARTYNYTMITS